jgi:hypothetical protein
MSSRGGDRQQVADWTHSAPPLSHRWPLGAILAYVRSITSSLPRCEPPVGRAAAEASRALNSACRRHTQGPRGLTDCVDKLRVPAVADRVAQMVVKEPLSQISRPYFLQTPTVTGRENRRLTQSGAPESDVGSPVGFSSLALLYRLPLPVRKAWLGSSDLRIREVGTQFHHRLLNSGPSCKASGTCSR